MRHTSKNQKRLYMFIFHLAMFVILLTQTYAVADASGEASASMTVKEITIFKDGHAFVLHEGEITGEFLRSEFDQKQIMDCAMGHTENITVKKNGVMENE